MTLPPIVDRELRVVARRWTPFWVRLGTALVAVILFALIHDTAASGTSSAKVAQTMFVTLSVVAFVVSLLSGSYLTADCISAEKREGTLGLLFLTDLKGHDVVLGKLAATSINTACTILAIIPAMALPIVMGGVTGGEFVRVSLALVITLLLSLSSGLFVSTLKCSRPWTQVAAVGAIIGLGGVVPLVWWVSRMAVRVAGIPDAIMLGLSPMITFIASFDVFHAIPFYSRLFWVALGSQSVLTVALLAGTSWILPKVWQEGEQRAVQHQDRRGRQTVGRTFAVWEKRFVRSGASANPTGWLVWREGRLPSRMTVLAGIAMALWLALALGCLVVESFAWRSRLMTMLVGLCAVGHLLLKLVLNVESPRRFSLDRQSRALELLMVTPLSNRSIALGIWQGLRDTFAVPVIALAAMNLMTAVLVLGLPGPPNLVLSPGWIAALLLAGIPLLLTDCYAIGWSGLRLGLARQRHHLAVRGVFVTVLLPPWILGAILWAMSISSGAVDEAHLFMFWFLVTLLLDVAIGVVSRTEVFDQLRRLVTEGRIQPVKPDAPAVEPVALAPANS